MWQIRCMDGTEPRLTGIEYVPKKYGERSAVMIQSKLYLFFIYFFHEIVKVRWHQVRDGDGSGNRSGGELRLHKANISQSFWSENLLKGNHFEGKPYQRHYRWNNTLMIGISRRTRKLIVLRTNCIEIKKRKSEYYQFVFQYVFFAVLKMILHMKNTPSSTI